MWWTILGSITFAVTFATALRITLGNRQIASLQEQDPAGVDCWPSVSIVVAARCEEANIEAGLQSLLQLDYDDYEIIAINDRSTDRTGEILDTFADRHSKLSVLHVEDLPAGWLGKNHAQWHGAKQAGGEYLLFTDADVVMDPQTLRKALAYVVREGADHLAASPEPRMPSLFLQAFVVLFVDLFGIFTRPWKVADPRSPAFVGIGAFNLVRSDVYHKIGTHRVIAMRPDDDLKLGKVIKMQGYRQRILVGTGMIRVPWYSSLRELIVGMEKNAFSGVDYRVSMVLLATIVLVLFAVWPFAAVWVLAGPARFLYAGTILVLLGRSLTTAVEMRQSRWSVLLLPVAVTLLIYIQWRAMLLTYINGGIRWRETHYPLAELKANKV